MAKFVDSVTHLALPAEDLLASLCDRHAADGQLDLDALGKIIEDYGKQGETKARDLTRQLAGEVIRLVPEESPDVHCSFDDTKAKMLAHSCMSFLSMYWRMFRNLRQNGLVYARAYHKKLEYNADGNVKQDEFIYRFGLVLSYARSSPAESQPPGSPPKEGQSFNFFSARRREAATDAQTRISSNVSSPSRSNADKLEELCGDDPAHTDLKQLCLKASMRLQYLAL